MAWMQELQWDWHIVFTDAFSSTLPTRLTTEPCHKENSLGLSTENESQAPPVKLNLLGQIKSFAIIKHPKKADKAPNKNIGLLPIFPINNETGISVNAIVKN